jgi:TPP-dependent pyruvate/acetoin dehydrogenase alpha subunit
VDDADAMVAKAAFRQRGVNFRLVADEVDGGDFLALLERAFHARDDDTAAVVAAHDIHCDSHDGF